MSLIFFLKPHYPGFDTLPYEELKKLVRHIRRRSQEEKEERREQIQQHRVILETSERASLPRRTRDISIKVARKTIEELKELISFTEDLLKTIEYFKQKQAQDQLREALEYLESMCRYERYLGRISILYGQYLRNRDNDDLLLLMMML